MIFAFATSSSMGPLTAGLIVDQTGSYFFAFVPAGAFVAAALFLLGLLRIHINRRTA